MVRAAGIEPAQVLRPYGFSYHLDFRRRQPRSWSGLYLHLDLPALGAAHLVSTPSRFRAWLGIATCEVSPFYIQGFPRSTQFLFKSVASTSFATPA